MKNKILLTTVMLFSLLTWAGDTPWPWGTECPLSWGTIEGAWSIRTQEGQSLESSIEIEVVSVLDDGTRVLNVTEYDQNGRLRFAGRGLVAPGERVVQAGMHSVDGKGVGFWAIIRTYEEGRGPETNNTLSCERSRTITAVTFRPMTGCKCSAEDRHYILEKIQ